jgi:hypothetical protein
MRLLLPILLGSAVILGTGSAAPVPRDGEKPALYFPTQVGTKFAYKDQSGDDFQSAATITGADTKDGVTTVSVEWVHFNKQDGKRLLKEKLAVSAKGVFRVSLNGTELTPPLCLLKLPVKKDDKWDTSFTSDGVKSEGRAVAGESQEVKTPAGKFTVVPVHYEYTIEKQTRRMTRWFAPQVGVVQESSRGYKDEPVLLVLKTFELPNRDAPPAP